MKNITVIDAQGGGLGAAIVKKLCDRYAGRIQITALGTNAIATAAMKKAGAQRCATGENAIRVGAKNADLIVGGIGILAPSGMLGEVTPIMAQAVSESAAPKLLIPISRCNITVAGTESLAVNDLINSAIAKAGEAL